MIYVKHRNILPDQSLFQNQIREILNEEVYGDIDDIFLTVLKNDIWICHVLAQE